MNEHIQWLENVFSQTADEGYFDFARCKRANGTFYGTSGKCKKGVEVGAKETTKSTTIKKKLRTKLDVRQGQKTSPKYNSTPGSSKPLAKLSPKEELKLAEAHLIKLKSERDRLTGIKEPTIQEKSDLFIVKVQMSSTEARVQDIKDGYAPDGPSLSEIYNRQGFNAKPELVQTRSDLEKHTDVLKQPNGENLILYRGVTTIDHANQFRGTGPDGETHFPGKGIFGNGTYAAAPGPLLPDNKQRAIDSAKAYAGGDEDVGSRITAFALRADANVVRFGNGNDQEFRYMMWTEKITKEAEEKTGMYYNDVGEAAAALGIHAYQVPQPARDDYWVILNRGAIIAAVDSEI